MTLASRSQNTFLDLIDTMQASEASPNRLFGGEGKSMHKLRESRQADPRYQQALMEATRFVADVYTGRKSMDRFREALGTSDFPLLFGDIIDRQLLANYRETPYSYRSWAAVKTVSDFRTVKRFAMNGAEGVLPVVGQQEEYPEVKLSDAAYSYAVKKYGHAIPFSWEAMVNDDLDALKDIPARFGRGARRSEEKFATGLICDVNGPHASFYTTGNKNRIHTENGAAANNPALSIAALQDAMMVLSKQVDADGEPIVIESMTLLVPPALRIVAENILNATELWLNLAAAADTQQIHTGNWIKGMVNLQVGWYIPIVASTAHGNTSWWLFADPNTSRPAVEVGFLRGHEEPEVFIKDPNAMRVGGGAVTPMDGDFDTDSLRYKVRHVFGGVREDYKATVASNGSGS